MATCKLFLNVIGFSWEMSPLMSRRGSCALLGNLERPIFELQSLVTIVVLVLSLYDTLDFWVGSCCCPFSCVGKDFGLLLFLFWVMKPFFSSPEAERSKGWVFRNWLTEGSWFWCKLTILSTLWVQSRYLNVLVVDNKL